MGPDAAKPSHYQPGYNKVFVKNKYQQLYYSILQTTLRMISMVKSPVNTWSA